MSLEHVFATSKKVYENLILIYTRIIGVDLVVSILVSYTGDLGSDQFPTNGIGFIPYN